MVGFRISDTTPTVYPLGYSQRIVKTMNQPVMVRIPISRLTIVEGRRKVIPQLMTVSSFCGVEGSIKAVRTSGGERISLAIFVGFRELPFVTDRPHGLL